MGAMASRIIALIGTLVAVVICRALRSTTQIAAARRVIAGQTSRATEKGRAYARLIRCGSIALI